MRRVGGHAASERLASEGFWEWDDPGCGRVFANGDDGRQWDRRGGYFRCPEEWTGATEDRRQCSTEESVLSMPSPGHILFTPSHRIYFIGIGGRGMRELRKMTIQLARRTLRRGWRAS